MPPRIALFSRTAHFRPALQFCIIVGLLATLAQAQQPQRLVGDANVESFADGSPSGYARAFPVKASATGQIQSLSVYVDRPNQAHTIWVGVYSNGNGHPQALLSKAVISSPAAGQWNSVNLAPVPVVAGTTYWFGLVATDGAVRFRDLIGRCRSEWGGVSNLSSLPATWTPGFGWPTCAVSMFGTGSTSAVTPPATASVSVSPHAVTLTAGKQQLFAANVTGMSNATVTWSATSGTITSGGLYTSPSTAGTFTITAKAATGGTQASDSAVVTVTQNTPTSTPPTVTGVSISPTAASLQVMAQQQFSAVVSGTAGGGVNWFASAGSITSSGLYTAPAAAGTYTITAVSRADSTKSASALAVVSAPQTVALSISPASGSISVGGQIQFSASVSGSSNQAVTWSVTRGKGTITQSGLYTAPGAAESDSVTATSQADSTKSASVTVNVVGAHSVSLQWSASPSSVSYYNVYRGTVSGGPYTLLSSKITSLSFTDSTVQPGVTYYYVTTAVDPSGKESSFSNEFQSIIPSP